MKIIYMLFFAAACFACDGVALEGPKVLNPDRKGIKKSIRPFQKEKHLKGNTALQKHLNNYSNLKSSIQRRKQKIRGMNQLKLRTKQEMAKTYISSTLVDSIFPYWLGTPWDFNGYTEKPRAGKIACGYFVSTTLRDVGFQINRYKIAQKGATDIIKAVCGSEAIHRYTDFSKFKSFVDQGKEGQVMIIGLDYHVGFLFRKDEQTYFAHSNYFNQKVVIEKIEESVALKQTKSYVVADLFHNTTLLNKWLNQNT